MNEKSGEESMDREWEGVLVPPAFFTGLGIGLAFGQPDVRVFVGSEQDSSGMLLSGAEKCRGPNE